ncbi:hypothetical protein JH06_1155 [Blastocystis sp. subtype 4]|uniref:hypothetical protein n=1 Tax=Blastocystis sp. subtype 4 TaxID=944170 RepID=UPI0007116D19|nr:hypothetical protein JH06_1155 [Blastocystis sp. subtype 4]KNB45454.1 hypothetical protein JH06_1155 [Blastocystis sp. subtype 4]|eukprot:XP_014528894.1 hypothetical protein JH06_1155 [Blastocystis sp. subtype 4]
MLAILFLLIPTLVEMLSDNLNATILELTYLNGLYYLNGTIKGYGTNTNTPALLAKSQSSIVNPSEINVDDDRLWNVHSDLGIQELILGESWKKNAVINNPKSDISNDIVTPHFAGWYDNANGIFGLGLPGNRIGSVSLSESLHLSSFGLFFSEPDPRIDFNYFDGIFVRFSSLIETMSGQIIWGEKMSGSYTTWFHYYFSLYSFSICDTSLFGPFTIAYPATISTTSRCLTVPMQIFNNLIGWLPIECPIGEGSGHSQLCWLNGSWDQSEGYPTFEFHLSTITDTLFISLGDLIITDKDRQYLCIMNGTDVNHRITHPLKTQGFVFGTMALKAFYVAVNVTAGRVGLVQVNETSKQRGNCKLNQRCMKGQTFNRASNECMEPNCDAYYFMTLNEEKHECRTHPIAIILFWSIVIYYMCVRD